MTNVPLGKTAYKRTYAQEPEIELLNRFFEKNPTNQAEQSALLTRPGNAYFIGAGTGKVRNMDHQPGAFGGDLFFVVGEDLFRWDGVNDPVAISGTIAGTGKPEMTFVTGADYERMFIADGLTLKYYEGQAYATGTLTVAGGNVANGDTVTIDLAYYEWTNGSVDTGSPDGSVSDPYLVDLGANDTEALANLIDALNLTGTAGTTYSTATQINANVAGVSSDDDSMSVRARVRGTSGNSIATTETGTNISWGAATLEGGGAQALIGVVTPDDVGIVSLTSLDSFVICVVSNSDRFYWIRPGETTIDALDFATAESEPDQLIQVLRVGDSLWFLGQTSTEVWYATGAADPTDAQFAPQKGLSFSQGVIEGTAVQVRNQVYLVAEDQIVYKTVGGVEAISHNGINERVRLAQTALEGS